MQNLNIRAFMNRLLEATLTDYIYWSTSGTGDLVYDDDTDVFIASIPISANNPSEIYPVPRLVWYEIMLSSTELSLIDLPADGDHVHVLKVTNTRNASWDAKLLREAIVLNIHRQQQDILDLALLGV